MMLHEQIESVFVVTNKDTGEQWEINPMDHLSALQLRVVAFLLYCSRPHFDFMLGRLASEKALSAFKSAIRVSIKIISASNPAGLGTASYAARSWSKPRRVIARIEASAMGSDAHFVVTNLTGRSKHLYEKVYCRRGAMENLIKEHKLYTKSDRTSCHRWEANQFRLYLHTAAYWLLHGLRGAAPKRSRWRNATFET